MRPSNNLKNKTLSGTYWRVQLVSMKVQAHRFLEQPRKYDQDQTPLMNQGSGSYGNIRQFQQFQIQIRQISSRKENG